MPFYILLCAEVGHIFCFENIYYAIPNHWIFCPLCLLTQHPQLLLHPKPLSQFKHTHSVIYTLCTYFFMRNLTCIFNCASIFIRIIQVSSLIQCCMNLLFASILFFHKHCYFSYAVLYENLQECIYYVFIGNKGLHKNIGILCI